MLLLDMVYDQRVLMWNPTGHILEQGALSLRLGVLRSPRASPAKRLHS